MPPVVVAAGIAGAAGIGGAIISSNAASNAANTAANTADKNNAIALQQKAEDTLRLQPYSDRGNVAGGYISDLLGIGGDPAKANAAFDQFRNSTDYQFQLQQGLGAVNANAYAKGMGQSGAAYKALQDRGMQLANASANNYIGQLTNVQNAGVSAGSALAGVGQNTVQNVTANNNNASDAAGNAALVSGNAWSNALANIGNAAGYAYGSSYKPKTQTQAPMLPPNYVPGYGGYSYGGYGGRA